MNAPQYFTSWTLTSAEAKKEYHTLVRENHPDLHQDEVLKYTEIMKVVNDEFAKIMAMSLRSENVNFDGMKDESGHAVYSEDIARKIAEIIESIFHMSGIEIEIVGCWVYVGGNSYPYRQELGSLGFRWSGTKKKWYIAPYKLNKRIRGRFTYEQVKALHGSTKVETREVKKLG